jgi:hypothetical protein
LHRRHRFANRARSVIEFAAPSREEIMGTAVEALPVTANKQPLTSIPPIFQNKAPFSLASVMVDLDWM